MDSGIDTLHPEFSGRLLAGFDAFATDSINTHGYPFLDYEQNAHGTACAGIIAAEQDNNIGISGIAPHAKLVPVRIFFYINLNNQFDTYGRISPQGSLQNSNSAIYIDSLKPGLYFISANSVTLRFEVIK